MGILTQITAYFGFWITVLGFFAAIDDGPPQILLLGLSLIIFSILLVVLQTLINKIIVSLQKPPARRDANIKMKPSLPVYRLNATAFVKHQRLRRLHHHRDF